LRESRYFLGHRYEATETGRTLAAVAATLRTARKIVRARPGVFPLPSRSGSTLRAGHAETSAERALLVVQRNLGLILVCLALVPAAALAFSLLQEEEYTASASLLFRENELEQRLFGGPVLQPRSDPERVAATNLKLVSLEVVADRTAKVLDRGGLTGEKVAEKTEVEPQGVSDLVSIRATDREPRVAADIANAFALEFISFRRNVDRAKIRSAQEVVERRLALLSPAARSGVEAGQLQERARDLEVLASLQTGNVELVQRASPPSSPSSPKLVRNVVLGIFLGLALGATLTVLREQLDRRLKDPEEVARVFELPVLASIPESRQLSGEAPGWEGGPAGAETEAFMKLRANLKYFNVDEEIRSILVTSASVRDGKTTVSWNLASVEARAGKRILLLDADLRRPALGREMGGLDEGLSHVLAGTVEVEWAVRTVDGVDVIPAGPPPPNPTELVESDRMRDVLSWAEQHYDLVIIDTPAVVADAIPLMEQVSGVLVVVRLGHTRRDVAVELAEGLSNMEASVLGVVLNGAGASPKTYHYRTPVYQAPAVSVPGPNGGGAEGGAEEAAEAPLSEDQQTKRRSGRPRQGRTSA
jgi:tyrosine-protein kinase